MYELNTSSLQKFCFLLKAEGLEAFWKQSGSWSNRRGAWKLKALTFIRVQEILETASKSAYCTLTNDIFKGGLDYATRADMVHIIRLLNSCNMDVKF